MAKRHQPASDDGSVFDIKDEPTPGSPPLTPSPKKGRKSNTNTTTGTPSPLKTSGANGFAGSSAATKRGMYMEMIFEAGLKSLNKQDVQAHTGLTPAQQQEMVRKDKGALRRAFSTFVAGL